MTNKMNLLSLWLALMAAAIVMGQDSGPAPVEESLRAFRTEPGVRIELAAAEPVVGDPVALAFDEAGVLFVAENRGYPTGPGVGQPPLGVIARLEDRDGDGRFETRGVFAEGLTFPNGVMPWKGGLLVTCAPDLLFLKDTNGDGAADLRQVVLTGFATNGSTQLRVSHPTLGVDNWIYLAGGLSGGTIQSPQHPERPPVEMGRMDARFHPETLQVELVDGKAQFGLTFNDAGHRFICMNRVQAQHVVLASRYLRRNPAFAFADTVQNLPETTLPEPLRGHGAAAPLFPISANVTTADSHAGTFTAACGVLIYRGTALPRQYWGNVFSCDPTGNLIHRDTLAAKGATYGARRAAESVEFAASTDNWFRPVFLANGPDGALYVCDMYRKTIEHPDYLPEEIRKRTDFESGRGLGRIYRITGEPASARPRVGAPGEGSWASATAAELVNGLNHAQGWRRDTAQRLLLERRDAAAIPGLKALVRARETEGGEAARVRALRLLEFFGALDDSLLALALSDPAGAVRENALQALEARFRDGVSQPSDWPLLSSAGDEEARVRFQTALILGEISHAGATEALANIALRDAADRWARAAVLSSLKGRGRTFFERLAAALDVEPGLIRREGIADLMIEAGRLAGEGQVAEEIEEVFGLIVDSSNARTLEWRVAALSGLARSLRGRNPDGSSAIERFVKGDDARAAQPKTSAAARVLGWRRVLERGAELLRDPEEVLSLRAAGASLLGEGTYQEFGPSLLAALNLREPAAVQTAAAEALGRLEDRAALREVFNLDRWRGYTPSVREAVLAQFLSRPGHVQGVLDLIEAGGLPANALDAARRGRLRQHADPNIRARAAALFKNEAGEDRSRVFEDYKRVLRLPSDPRNGRAVFKTHCSACHRLDREGVAVGPDLFGIRNQSKETILLHVLAPDLEIVPGFAGYQLETKDGRQFSGLLVSETAVSITLRGASGIEETFLRQNVAEFGSTSLSLMPQELEKNMTRQEMADLVSYLKGE